MPRPQRKENTGCFVALGPATTAGLLAAFVATVILALFVPQPLFGQWFVSSRGDDLNPGTETEPFRTIFRGHEVASAGDTIYLRGGTYDSLLSTITLSKSGSPTSR